ncbi:MAG: DUF5050 domain-containing protein [Clostridia bacterium]|nr:DUF5050 domain-containing protein [Clostridia bacterium]
MNSKNYMSILILIAVSTFLISCSMTVKPSDQDFERDFTKQRNHVQSGRVLHDQEDVYFSVLSEITYDRQKSATRHGSIFRTDIKGDKLFKIADQYARFLTIHNEWLYFSSENLYRMPKEGGVTELLISGHDLEFTIHKDKIYYVDRSAEEGVYESNLDGSSRRKIFDGGATDLMVHDDIMYIVRKADFKLHAISIRNNQNSSIIKDSVGQYCIDGQKVIYTGEGLYVQSLQGDFRTIKIDDFVSTFNLKGEWIYYISASEGDMLKPILNKAHRDGTERIALLDHDINFYDMEIYIAGDWIYLYNRYEPEQFVRMDLDGKGLQVLRLGKNYKGGSVVEIINKSL